MKRILLIALMVVLFKCNAICMNYRAVYQFEYTQDSINSIKGKDLLYLEISENSSFCFSYYSYYTDSLMSTPNGNSVWRKMFSAAIKKEGHNATSFPHKRSTFMISKSMDTDVLSVKDAIGDDIYSYDIRKDEFDWEICDSTKNINGYLSYMAKCNYHGRDWEVWFTLDIPFSDGPWVLCGLPGLIIEATDKDRLFSFRMFDFTANKDVKRDWTKEGKKVDRLAFLRLKYKYIKNLNATLNAEMGMNITPGRDTRYLNGLEPDFRK